MFELKFKRFEVAFEFSFFAVMTLMMLFGSNEYITIAFVACLWHETGHLLMMFLNHIKVCKICFYGAGVKIQPDKMFDFTPTGTRVAVLLAGSALNFVTFLLLNNSEYAVLCVFAAVNAAIGAFNLLPLQFLDGGKILVIIIHTLCSYPRALLLERFLKWFNVILIIIVLIVLSFVGKGNITLFITLCCLLFSALSY